MLPRLTLICCVCLLRPRLSELYRYIISRLLIYNRLCCTSGPCFVFGLPAPGKCAPVTVAFPSLAF